MWTELETKMETSNTTQTWKCKQATEKCGLDSSSLNSETRKPSWDTLGLQQCNPKSTENKGGSIAANSHSSCAQRWPLNTGWCMCTPTSRKNQPRQSPPILEPLYVAQVILPTTSGNKQTLASKLAEQASTQMGDGKIPAKYQHHAQVFSKEAAKWFPEPHIWDHDIKLKPRAPSSIPGKVYQLTQDEQKVLLKFVQEKQAKGYIYPLKSPYAAPFFFIKKKDGKLCPVQDYRWLNEWTICNHYPIPLISELIAKVQGAKLFTKVDLQQGYNNVHIWKGDEWKAAFITNHGLFKPTVMFFRLTNSPATFQTMMNAIFSDEIAEGWLIIYIDDILIATKDDL